MQTVGVINMRKMPAISLVLVNPVLRHLSGELQDSPQLGLVFIGTVARNAGYEVTIIAGENVLEKLSSALRSREKALVGFYANSDNFQEVIRLAKGVKALRPDVHTIVGGPLANIEDPRLIANAAIDFNCRGDGEHLVTELLAHLAWGEPPIASIRGLTHKSEGNVTTNEPRDLQVDLDALPIPDRSLYPSTQVGIKSQVVTSRGCGFRCTFCFESTNRKYRAHSPQRVVEEMLYLQEEYGTTYFSFVDDIFTQNRKRVLQICDLLHQHFRPHVNLFWYCEARVDQIAKNPDLLRTMSAAGLTRIQIGTESGSQAVIDAYKKQITLDQILQTVQLAAEADVLSIFTNFIVGGAIETEDTVMETINLARRLFHLAPGRFECNATFLSPYPGTDIQRRPASYSIRILDPDFITGLSDDHIFCETIDLSAPRIVELMRDFRAACAVEMVELIPELSSELILRHLKMNQHKLVTQWSDVFRTDPILQSCASFTAQPHYRRFTSGDDLRKSDPGNIIPIRTFSFRSINAAGQLSWALRNKGIEFGPYEQFLIGLCAGKLTLAEILSKAHDYWGARSTPPTFENDVLNFFALLSSEMLLVFREIFQVGVVAVTTREQITPLKAPADPLVSGRMQLGSGIGHVALE
jgi:anaerobic magnesium-protoporphyrin IX monomethyl ester cyclase